MECPIRVVFVDFLPGGDPLDDFHDPFKALGSIATSLFLGRPTVAYLQAINVSRVDPAREEVVEPRVHSLRQQSGNDQLVYVERRRVPEIKDQWVTERVRTLIECVLPSHPTK